MAMVDELIKDITRGVEYLDSHFTINVNDVHKPEGKSLAVSLPTTLPLLCVKYIFCPHQALVPGIPCILTTLRTASIASNTNE